MIDEISRSIRAHLYERITNPLLGAVAVAWFFWNYKLVLILFYSVSPDVKISFIEGVLYPQWYDGVLFLVVLPFVSGMAFLYAYPFPAKYVYRYTRNQLKELKKIKMEVEDETPASKEEHISLKRKVNFLENLYYSDITEKDSEIARLKALLKDEKRSLSQSSSIRSSQKDYTGARKEIERRSEQKKLLSSGEIVHKEILRLNIGGREYDSENYIKNHGSGEVNVFRLLDKYNYEDVIKVKVELSSPLESDQVLWIFDGYSAREIKSMEFELQKADFSMKSARIAVQQPNPLRQGKDMTVSNIVQFEY